MTMTTAVAFTASCLLSHLEERSEVVVELDVPGRVIEARGLPAPLVPCRAQKTGEGAASRSTNTMSKVT